VPLMRRRRTEPSTKRKRVNIFHCVYMTRRIREDEVDVADAGDTGLVHPFIPGNQMLCVRLNCCSRLPGQSVPVQSDLRWRHLFHSHVGCRWLVNDTFTFICVYRHEGVLLKTREWKTREWKTRHQTAGVENAGVVILLCGRATPAFSPA